jgi:uncharacterized protein YgiM (DUF1202 family)
MVGAMRRAGVAVVITGMLVGAAASAVGASAPRALQCVNGQSYHVFTPDKPRNYVVVGAKQVNVRTEPGVGCSMLGKIKKGTRLVGTGKRAKVEKVLWRQVASPFGISWVAAKYLKAVKGKVPPLTSTSTSTPTSTS